MTTETLPELVKQLELQCGFSEPDADYKFADSAQQQKLHGAPQPGSRVRIYFGNFGDGDDGYDITDEGYIFTLPGIEDDDVWMAGVVHIPHPDNPGGKGDNAPVWCTLDELLKNPQITKVEVLP